MSHDERVAAMVELTSRENWVGTVAQFEALGELLDLRVHVEPCWRGPGTVLFVLSEPDGTPVKGDGLQVWREMVGDLAAVSALCTSVSVG